MRVNRNLERLGLITSPDKCELAPVWCGFDWDLKTFRVEVTGSKKERIRVMSEELLNKQIILLSKGW